MEEQKIYFLRELDKYANHAIRECITADKQYDYAHFTQIEPKNYIVYLPVIIRNGDINERFLIKKQEKTRLLILDEAQKVYLSDASIISTILNMDGQDIDWFLRQFIELYQSARHKIIIEIPRLRDSGTEDPSFEAAGIDNYPAPKQMSLKSDTRISFQAFCLYLGFIFAKDACYEEMEEQGHGLGKATLCKYIALISYYTKHDEWSRAFLETIGYPVDKITIDALTENSAIFKNAENIKKFDISHYLCYINRGPQ